MRLATAVYVGVGKTAVNQQMYAGDEAGASLRSKIVRAWLPYGGLSTGMLLAVHQYPLDPDETDKPEIEWAHGLGQFSGALCEPHYSTKNRAGAF